MKIYIALCHPSLFPASFKTLKKVRTNSCLAMNVDRLTILYQYKVICYLSLTIHLKLNESFQIESEMLGHYQFIFLYMYLFSTLYG